MNSTTFGSITLTYPESHIWQGDDNFVLLEVSSGAIAATITITQGANTRTLSYESESKVLRFALTDTLKTLTLDTQVSVTVAASVNGTSQGSSAFNTTMHHGKTLSSRYHGSPSVVVLESGTSVELFYPGAGYWEAGGSVTSCTAGIVSVTLSGGSKRITQTVTGGCYKGELWDSTFSTMHYVDVITPCTPVHGITIHYYDTDGIERVAIGEVKNAKTSAERVEYSTNETIILKRAESAITGVSQSVEVAFADVPKGQYLGDVIISDEVWCVVNGETIPLTVVTSDIIDEGKDTADYLIEFQLQRA